MSHKGRYEILGSTSHVLRRGKAQSVPNPWWRRGGRSLLRISDIDNPSLPPVRPCDLRREVMRLPGGLFKKPRISVRIRGFDILTHQPGSSSASRTELCGSTFYEMWSAAVLH